MGYLNGEPHVARDGLERQICNGSVTFDVVCPVGRLLTVYRGCLSKVSVYQCLYTYAQLRPRDGLAFDNAP